MFSLYSGNTVSTQFNCITFIQRRPNVFDVGPILYKWYANVCVYRVVALLKMLSLRILFQTDGNYTDNFFISSICVFVFVH